MVDQHISPTIVNAAQLTERASQVAARPNPVPPAGLVDKTRWLQVVIKNETQFSIAPIENYFNSGRYWTPPTAIAPFVQSDFSVCNGDLSPAGATGGTAFSLCLDSAHHYHFALGWTAPSIGSYKSAIVASSHAQDGYNAARPEGNVLVSDNIYTGQDDAGESIRFRLQLSTVPGEHLILVVLNQVRLYDSPMKFAKGSAQSVTATKFHCEFEIDGIINHFSANVSVSVESWTCQNATLEYANKEALTATRQYYGRIGQKTGLELFLSNGVVIRGTLDPPARPTVDVTAGGTGVWAQN